MMLNIDSYCVYTVAFQGQTFPNSSYGVLPCLSLLVSAMLLVYNSPHNIKHISIARAVASLA